MNKKSKKENLDILFSRDNPDIVMIIAIAVKVTYFSVLRVLNVSVCWRVCECIDIYSV